MVHILVLEDDAKLNQAVCTYLNDSGFAAKGCLSANDAYDEMYNQLYDLIISDIMMPEMCIRDRSGNTVYNISIRVIWRQAWKI